MKKCLSCGRVYSDLVTICPQCRTSLQTQAVQQHSIAVEPGSVAANQNPVSSAPKAGSAVPVSGGSASCAANPIPITYATRNQFPPTPEEEFEIYDIGYDCGIRRYTGNRSMVVIPTMIRGHRVVEIGRIAFYGHSTALFSGKPIESIIIPCSVHTIGDSAFFRCHKLRTVIAHPDIVKIGNGAFIECPLEVLDFGITAAKPRVVYFPPNLKSIGVDAFMSNRNDFRDVVNGAQVPFEEVWLSRATKVKTLMMMGKSLSHKSCAIYYYEENAIR